MSEAQCDHCRGFGFTGCDDLKFDESRRGIPAGVLYAVGIPCQHCIAGQIWEEQRAEWNLPILPRAPRPGKEPGVRVREGQPVSASPKIESLVRDAARNASLPPIPSGRRITEADIARELAAVRERRNGAPHSDEAATPMSREQK